MASLIEELITTLASEVDQYKELVMLADFKREILVKGDIDGLNDITRQEQKFAATLQRLEKHREKVIEDIALVTNQRKSELTISKLMLLLKNQTDECESIKNISNQLIKLLGELKSKNELNNQLTKQSLELIDFTFNALKSSKEMPTGNNYQQKGMLYQQNQGNNYFDAKQ